MRQQNQQCQLLYSVHSNYGPFLLRFRDMTTGRTTTCIRQTNGPTEQRWQASHLASNESEQMNFLGDVIDIDMENWHLYISAELHLLPVCRRSKFLIRHGSYCQVDTVSSEPVLDSRYRTSYIGSKSDTTQSHSYYGRRIGNRTQAFEQYWFE